MPVAHQSLSHVQGACAEGCPFPGVLVHLGFHLAIGLGTTGDEHQRHRQQGHDLRQLHTAEGGDLHHMRKIAHTGRGQEAAQSADGRNAQKERDTTPDGGLAAPGRNAEPGHRQCGKQDCRAQGAGGRGQSAGGHGGRGRQHHVGGQQAPEQPGRQGAKQPHQPDEGRPNPGQEHDEGRRRHRGERVDLGLPKSKTRLLHLAAYAAHVLLRGRDGILGRPVVRAQVAKAHITLAHRLQEALHGTLGGHLDHLRLCQGMAADNPALHGAGHFGVPKLLGHLDIAEPYAPLLHLCGGVFDQVVDPVDLQA